MERHEKTLFFVALLLIVGLVGLNFYVGQIYETNDSDQILQKKSGGLLTGAAIGVLEEVSLSSLVGIGQFETCWEYRNTNNATCVESGVANGANCVWETPEEDPYCDQEIGCCIDLGCYFYDDHNASDCESDSEGYGLNCTWDPYMTIWYPNGTQGTPGGCMPDWSSSNETWGGVAEGCWQYDGDQASCGAQGSTCKWTANGQNQEPWCGIKSLSDAQNEFASATIDDIGCCEQANCWMHDNNESNCLNAFQGNCFYTNNSYGGGWCSVKTCEEITTEDNCTYAKQNLMQPCDWNGSMCSSGEYGQGGFGFYNDTDSCFDAGGWYNSSGSCIMPTNGGNTGGGGFLFAGDAHCWFADNKPSVCGNITGCAYCAEGPGLMGILNSSSICYNDRVGNCEGHVFGDSLYPDANNTANLGCGDINLKTACNYGPLPNCKWTNSTVIVGSYCEVGAKSEKETAPRAQYCDDPIAKNNFTLCTQLAEEYMMPCIWQNTTLPYTNCTFNSAAVFGSSGGEQDFNLIPSSSTCVAAGGSWQTESYVDAGILKTDSWCEMTGMFDIDQNQGTNNKANCDTSCWACEFQNNGTAWADLASAQSACEGSALGNCQWSTDAFAFNNLGFCDYPQEMEFGGSNDCNTECEGCNFMNSPQSACEGSVANSGTGCKWVSEGDNDFCVDKTKKVCSTNCFSCYDVSSCQDSSVDCSWDSTFGLCSPEGFTGERCFDGIDNDADTEVDCSDPDCGFDNFCGGSAFGGDCFAQTTEIGCGNTLAFDDLNCTWINDTWNPDGWCDMPGANCWKFNNDLATCGETPGCTNDSSSMGSNAWCEINMTRMDSSSCWGYSDESSCDLALGDCAWKTDMWCQDNLGDQWCIDNPNAGWCDYTPFATCMDLDEGSCGTESNCVWQEDEYSDWGWCDVACFDWALDESGCNAINGSSGLCEWKDSSSTCQPESFMMFAGDGSGGKSGCWQYDGNRTACNENNITCTYNSDNYANNGVAPDNEAGWCMDKSEYEHFGEMEGDVIDLAQDFGNVMGAAETGVVKEIDILGIGMRVTDVGFDFGAGILNVTETIMCDGFMVGNKDDFMAPKVQGAGNKTTKFYWYLDTDGISSGGCNAVNQSGSQLTGYDFLITYISRNTSDGIVETKQMMRCSNGVWNPTNALVSSSKMLSCGDLGGVMVALSKQDLESFSEYNKTAVMKIFMSSANGGNSNRTNPLDSVGPGYYTPGTVDFGFVDCSIPANSKDPKCKNFQKFGFNVFEECKNGVDDDENGLVDCDDPGCTYIPGECSVTGFNFVVDENDKVSPSVMFSKVEKLQDAAFLKIDTNEPSNLSIKFYRNDSTCKTVNMTLVDVGVGFQENANFKPFHSIDLMVDNLGYALTNNTVYYYKSVICDPSGNCGTSACSNFTTKVTATEKTFIFKIELEEGHTVDIPAFNKTDYNFTEEFAGVVYEVGIKTNTSVTKSMNMTVHCGDMSIGFFGMNVLGPTKIDLSTAFVCDALENLMGMNSTSKKWNKLIEDLHLGGAADYIEITIPVAYDVTNNLEWTDDVGADGQDVDAYTDCFGNSTHTICQIPVSMGFSAYTITAAAVVAPSSPGGGSGGGSGGGAAGGSTFIVNADQLTEGYSKELAEGDRFKVTIEEELHYVTLNETYSDRVKVIVQSDPQEATIYSEETKYFELTGDNKYDLSVTLGAINLTGEKATLTVKSESVLMSAIVDEEAVAEQVGEMVDEISSETAGDALGEALAGQEVKESDAGLWIVLAIVLLVLIVGIISFVTHKKRVSKAVISKRKK
jgi:hypothetical protein